MANNKQYYSNDWEGNLYFFDEVYKQWCIHDGKSKLYTAKCPKLIAYLEKHKTDTKNIKI